MKHYVITVARETGSGGHDIARRLSEELNIPYYDRDLLRKASEVSGIHERLFGAADERVGWKEMLSAAEKVYTGEILPLDSDDYISTRNLFSFQANHQGTGRHGKLHYSGTLRQLPADGAARRQAAAAVYPRAAGDPYGAGGLLFPGVEHA